MDSKITINIVEPGSPTPDPVAPSTGLFTHGIGGPEATIITAVSTVLLLTIVAVVVAMLYKKHKHQGKATKLVSTVDACATVVKSKKRVSAGLAAVALLVSAGTFAALLVNAGKSNTNAAEGEDGLTLDVSSEDLTIEVGDEPVFAVLPVELTVEEATQAGYTLTAFTDSTDLVSTTDESKVIPMVTLPEPLEPNEEGVGRGWGPVTSLTDNTYGLALDEKPTTKDAEVYTPLSTDSDTPTILKATDYEETEANDTTTIYYGFYITPDVPYGTYTGSDIYYDVEENYITNLSFDGNDSDGGTAMEGMTLLAGDTITLPENTYTREGYSFTGWNTAAEGTGKAYADEAEFTASLDKSEDVILYAQWALPVIGDLDEMQDFAKLTEAGKASVLASMTPDQQYQLQDNRDQTMYYIAKLADGNVWMTQNLDLDLNNQTELTPANTNITANWTPERNTIAKDDLSSSTWQNNRNNPYSYDPGDIYFYAASSSYSDKDGPYESLELCQGAHADCSMHNHAGNLYNWSAAVASNDTSEMPEGVRYNAPDSVCPAGWRLPVGLGSGDGDLAGNELGALLVDYSIISIDKGCAGSCHYYQSGGFDALRKAPLWFVRAGYTSYGSYNGGFEGQYWSSTLLNSDYASSMQLGEYVKSLAEDRYYGLSVRCIVQ